MTTEEQIKEQTDDLEFRLLHLEIKQLKKSLNWHKPKTRTMSKPFTQIKHRPISSYEIPGLLWNGYYQPRIDRRGY